MGCAIRLAALVAALFFDFFVKAGEGGTLVFGVFATIELGVGLRKIEVHFGAAGIEAHGGL
jgi:hypothetical protein